MKIETKRLILRDIGKKDEESIRKHINNLNVSKWLLAVSYPYKKKDADWWVSHCLENQKEKPRKSYNFGVVIKPNKEVVGGIGLTKVNREQRTAEIGYWLSEKYWKRGLMYEATLSVIKFAFNKLKLRKLIIRAYSKNRASNKLAKKLGAGKEGLLRKHAVCKATGKIHDEIIFGLLKEEWRKK